MFFLPLDCQAEIETITALTRIAIADVARQVGMLDEAVAMIRG